MANRQIYISIIDTDWPKIKLIINRDGQSVRTDTQSYDIATSQFTPAVQDALRLSVEDVIKSHKVR